MLNPQIEKKNTEFYKDIVLVVSDLTESILETKKDKEVLSVQKSVNEQLNSLNNVTTINITLSNDKEDRGTDEKEIETLLFKKINKTINNLNINRLSGLIVITDGQIHDFNNFNKLLSKIPIHYVLVGEENEKDRILTTKNVPEYAILGKKNHIGINIKDNINNKKLKTEIYLDEKLVDTKFFSPNTDHKYTLPVLHLGKNILEIKTEESLSEISTFNNSKIFEINGIQDKLKVMLISGEPNMGLRNLRNILNSDPNIELLHFTILRPPTKRDLTPVKELSLIPFPTQELFAADISKFNLIVFDQYGLQGILPSKYLDNISKFVISGGALLDITGKKYLTKDSLINSPIKQILPTTPIENFTKKKFRPKLTELGKRHPITNKLNESYFDNPWGRWDSFTKSNLISGKALLHHNDAPLLVVDNVGEGRVAQILSNQTWVWQKSLNDKGPLVELLRNTIQWLLKNPKMEENFINFYKKNDLIKIKLNSLSSEDIITTITTPSQKSFSLTLKDNGNGTFEGAFKSEETGKFKIILNNEIKKFIINNINNKETKEIISTDEVIKKYMKINNRDTKNFNIIWNIGYSPKVIKIYSNKVLGGKNWIGVLEKNIAKIDQKSRQNLFNWYIIFISLIIFIFLSWYKEGKN
tara:strand:+ start:23607 stop:25532 length:1926 start_codon:yes stop_codon:yes gene_type:complete